MIPAGFRQALRHLTVLPIPWDVREARATPATALPWFPLVGLIVGGVVSCVLALPLPALPRAALALAVWTAVTGGLHEDAWMDSADGALAVAARERRLEILKDPRVGAHAVTALVLVMLVRFSALASVPWSAPVVAATCGRWGMVLTLAHFPAARAEGLGAAFARNARGVAATLVALTIIAAVALLDGPRTLLSAACGMAAGMFTGAWLSTRFGGLTGDGHGAAGYAAETIALLTRVPFA